MFWKFSKTYFNNLCNSPIGSKSGGGGPFRSLPLRYRKLRIRTKNCKQRSIARWKTYNFCRKLFWVRLILRSPEVITNIMVHTYKIDSPRKVNFKIWPRKVMRHTNRRVMARRTVWYHLQVLSTIMSWFICQKKKLLMTSHDFRWPFLCPCQ